MATKHVLEVAQGEVGYKEGKNKDNKYGEWFGLNNTHWCMEFVQWCYAQCKAKLPLKTPSCGGLLGWYERNAPECITKDPIPGCIVIFGWKNSQYRTNHTGIFVKKDYTTITTIDGNTKKTSGSDDNGGWVNKRTRKINDIKNIWYIIPKELILLNEKIEKEKEEEEEMAVKRYQTLDEILVGAKWAYQTIKDLCDAKVLGGTGSGLDLSEDMLRMFVINDRAGLYEGVKKK